MADKCIIAYLHSYLVQNPIGTNGKWPTVPLPISEMKRKTPPKMRCWERWRGRGWGAGRGEAKREKWRTERKDGEGVNWVEPLEEENETVL